MITIAMCCYLMQNFPKKSKSIHQNSLYYQSSPLNSDDQCYDLLLPNIAASPHPLNFQVCPLKSDDHYYDVLLPNAAACQSNRIHDPLSF